MRRPELLAQRTGDAVEQFAFAEGFAQPLLCLQGGSNIAVVTRRDPYDRDVAGPELLREGSAAGRAKRIHVEERCVQSTRGHSIDGKANALAGTEDLAASVLQRVS